MVAASPRFVYKAAMRMLVAKLRLDRRTSGSSAKNAVIGLVFWAFIFTATLLNILSHPGNHFSKLSGDYFAFSLLFLSGAFVLSAIADLLHNSVFGVAIALRPVSALAILVAGVVFIVGGIYTTSGIENVAIIVGIFVMVAFGVPYLLRERDKRQDQS